MRLLDGLVSSFIVKGKLRVYDVSGNLHEYGSSRDGPSVTLRLHEKSLYRKLFLIPELAVAEAYMDGTLTFEDGSEIYDLLNLFSINRKPVGGGSLQRFVRQKWRAMRLRHDQNDVDDAKLNARSHYDLSTELYRLFLDPGMNYSCAYFHSPDDDLETAQNAKLKHAISKLRLELGTRVLEIGGGWGAFAIEMARAGASVTSLNVSTEQIAIAKQAAAEAGVGDKIEFILKDYREFEGNFDRVVSVGMMEHVGVRNYDLFFGKLRELLTPGGYAFIHSIGRMSPPGTTGPFIRKYIFPGAYSPALSEVFSATERSGLWIADMEVLRLHYHYTIKHWRRQFMENREKAVALYDERFCRMWEFYLIAVELEFKHGSGIVFQLLLSSARDSIPITRDFMFEAERKAS